MISITRELRKNYKSEILKGMPYEDITYDFLNKLSNKDLNSIHYTTHKFHTYSCRRPHFKKYIPLIKERHEWIIDIMKKRGLKHNSPLTCKE